MSSPLNKQTVLPQVIGSYQPPRGMLELSFPGQDGVPFRGQKTPLLKGDEIEQLQEIWDAHSRVFDLAKGEDHIAYNRICDNAAKKITLIRVHHVSWPDSAPAPRIFVAWLNRFVERPGAVYERAAKDADGQINFYSS